MPITIRQLTPDDTETFIVLRKAMLIESPASFGSDLASDRGSNPALVRKRLADRPHSATFGAFDDATGALIGALGFGRETRVKQAHSASLWGMYVDPAHRRRGVARQLIRTAIEYAAGLGGVARLSLCVSSSAPGAQKLYESMGFAVWGNEPDALRLEGESFDERHMTRAIGATDLGRDA